MHAMMKRFFLLLTVFILALTGRAEDFDPLAASIEDNLRTPAVPQKHSRAVVNAMNRLLRTLTELGYNASAVRDGEVVMVTIPVSDLFEPNSTALSTGASSKLRLLMPYIKRSDNYKVIIAAHSDNTGDELYNDRLTADRANAIDEYFYELNEQTDTGIIPYGLGYDEPVAANNSIEGRRRNRRIEIYFVPTSEFINKVRRRNN